MAVKRNLQAVKGLKEVEAMLDSLTDPKFRERALRNAGRRALKPVKEKLQANVPSGTSDTSSYPHYTSYKGTGYQSGDLRDGVVIKVKVNTSKKIRTNADGFAKDGQQAELVANVTFKDHLYKLASILENGRTKRIAKTEDGKVFHFMGRPTNQVERDIGTTSPKHFISQTFAQCESNMVKDFKVELIGSIHKQVKAMEKKK